MKTTKFYTYDERRQDPPGKLTDMIRRQISFDEAVKLDDQYGESLKKLEETFPSVKQEFDALDNKAIEVARELEGLRTVNSPRLMEQQKVLNKIVSERDMVMKNYQLSHNELVLNKEALTKPLINDQVADWRERRISLSAKVEITEQEEKRQLFGKSDFVIRSNRAALARILSFLLEKEITLRSMARNSLREISNFIKTTETEFETFDPNAMELETVEAQEYKEILENQKEAQVLPQNPQTVYDTGGKDSKGKKEFIKVNPNPSNPVQSSDALMGKFERLKGGFRPILSK